MGLMGDPFQIEDDSPPEEGSYTSSQTESLLGRQSSPPGLEKDGVLHRSQLTEEEDEDPETTDTEKQLRRPGATYIRIPTNQEVEEALSRGPRKRDNHVGKILGGLSVMLLLAWGLSQLLAIGTRFGAGGPKINVILMISDGMGPASETMSRSFLQFMNDAPSSLDPAHSLLNLSLWSALSSGYSKRPNGMYGITPLDEMLIGSSRTRSSNSLVTDSAAGATAFSCGIHTYNGAIGVEAEGKTPVGTVLEAAKRQGFSTGLVTTSRITHATPASFYAHVVDRDMESEIAQFLVGSGPRGTIVDVALGGGTCFFMPNSTTGSCRTDDEDLLAKARDSGFTILRGLKALNEWHDESGHEQAGPVLGFFHDDHMDFEIDRQQITVSSDEQPSLKQMAMHALSHLDKIDNKGFFLMIEGARIDMAGHNNDPVGHVSDMLAYHSTVNYLKKWVDDANESGTPTILISVSDHETGGLALGRQLGSKYPEYAWYPDALVNASHSTSWLGKQIAAKSDVTKIWLKEEIYSKGLGIVDVSDDEIDTLWPHIRSGHRANLILADAISRRAQVGWSTLGHSGVDVNLYAWGYNSTGLAGARENIEIGEHIAHAMGLQLDIVTAELNQNLAWHSVTAGKSADRTTHIQHYHGDF